MFNPRIGNIEVRPINNSNDYEFVVWSDDPESEEKYYVLAYAEPSTCGYDIRSMGDRPWALTEDDKDDYDELVKTFLFFMSFNLKL